jgi:hypothetical protein
MERVRDEGIQMIQMIQILMSMTHYRTVNKYEKVYNYMLVLGMDYTEVIQWREIL